MNHTNTNRLQCTRRALPALAAVALLATLPLAGCQKRTKNAVGTVGVTTAAGAAIGSLSGNMGQGAATGAIGGAAAILIQELFSDKDE